MSRYAYICTKFQEDKGYQVYVVMLKLDLDVRVEHFKVSSMN